MIERASLRDVLAQARPGVVLDAGHGARVGAALAQISAPTPWYLRVLIGLGAWFATWFLLSFVLALLAIPSSGGIDAPALAVGLALVPAAVVVRRSSRSDFLRELALVLSLTGQGLIIGSLGSMTSFSIASLAAIVLAAVLVPVFPDYLHRFVAVLVVVAALLVLGHEWRVAYSGDVVCAGLIAAVLYFWREAPEPWRSARDGSIEPLVAGAVVALLGLLLCGMALETAGVGDQAALHHGGVVTAAAALALLWLVQAVLAEHHAGTRDIVAVVAVLGALSAITWRTPAIVTTLFVMLLAFDRRSRASLGLAVAFFLVFGTLYYYNLELTLMQKSGVLTASGALCLAAWAVLSRRARVEAAP